jgi:hypothetical protein
MNPDEKAGELFSSGVDEKIVGLQGIYFLQFLCIISIELIAISVQARK